MQVVDAEQRPLRGHLAVRDRMFEAWTHDLQQNTTLDDSLDPIPTPPGARLVDGTAKLPRIRKGRVQFVVELDGGGRVFFTRDVDAAQPLAVRLPFPVR